MSFQNAFWLQCALVRMRTAHSSHLWFTVAKVGPNLLPNTLAAGKEIIHETIFFQCMLSYTVPGISEILWHRMEAIDEEQSSEHLKEALS